MKYRALLLCLLLVVLPSHVVFAQQDDADVRFGSVLVRSMDKIVVVAMDTGGEDRPGDGLVDQVFVYFLQEPLAEPFSFRTDRAMVLFGKNRVQVTSPDGPTRLTFTVRENSSPLPRPRPGGRKNEFCIEEPGQNILVPGGGVPRSLSLENGIGLAHYPKVNDLPFSQFEHGDLTRLNYRDFVSGIPSEFDIATKCAPQCASGGPGSTGCSVSTCCSVNCGSGYYACCHCTNGCSCVRN